MKRIGLILFMLLVILFIGCSPKQVKVTFKGFEGEIILEQVIQKGTNIAYPSEPEIEGYEFLGWDKTLEIAEEDVVISALLEKYKYYVIFYDDKKNLIDEQIVEHGDSATPPQLNLSNEYVLISWSEDYTNVTSDLELYPKIEKAYFTVSFYDSYGKVMDQQTIKNGEDAVAPEAPVVYGYEFSHWDREFTNVKRNLEIKPVYKKIDMGYEMENVNYWIQVLGLKYDMNNLIMTEAEIASYNKKIISDFDQTRTLDVTTIESITTGSYVKGLIEKYKNINNYTVYNNDTKVAITTNEKNEILNNRNLDVIPSNINVKFGVLQILHG